MKPVLSRHLQATLNKFIENTSLNKNPYYYVKRSYINETRNQKRKVLLRHLHSMKKRKENISLITAYDYNQAKLADSVGIDAILVGDSCANVMCGYHRTSKLSFDAMIHHCKSVINGTQHAYIIGDMTFGTYLTVYDALKNAARLISEAGVSCVKLEGFLPDTIREVSKFVPVCAHLGLLPQTHESFHLRGKEYNDIIALKENCLRLQDAGASLIVLEKVCTETAALITDALDIPTIGIGSGPFCDGQILIWHDILGLNVDAKPYKFVKQYGNLSKYIQNCLKEYISDVKSKTFPDKQHCWSVSDNVKDMLIQNNDISQEFFDRMGSGAIYYKYNDNDGSIDKNVFGFSKRNTVRISCPKELRDLRHKMYDKCVIFVPFLGGLHDGHISLIKKAIELKDDNTEIWTSLFLNPTQFNEQKDLDEYPYSMDYDIKILTQLGVDLIFTPIIEDIYPNYNNDNPILTPYISFNNLQYINEANQRPGHFNGVGTILTKLFAWIRPNKTIFGQKDFIQSRLVMNLCNEFFPDINVIIHDTIRESNGLAMSSRNNKLTQNERQYSHLLYQLLCLLGTFIKDKHINKDNLTPNDLQKMVQLYADKYRNNLELEYVQMHHYLNGLCLNDNDIIDLNTNKYVISIAGRIRCDNITSKTRLIDNIVIDKDNLNFNDITFVDDIQFHDILK